MRKLIIGAAAVVLTSGFALSACGPSRELIEDAGHDAGAAGCVGVCSQDAGTDAGPGTVDAGDFDAGPACDQFSLPTGGTVLSGTLDTGEPTTLQDLRYGTGADGGYVTFGSHVILTGVQVTGVNYINANPGPTSTTTEFWVTDPADPTSGFWVHLRATDVSYLPDGGSSYIPAVGDVLNLDGYFGTDSSTFSPFARRYTITNFYAGSGSPSNRPVTVAKVDSAPLKADNDVDAGCAFDAQQGLRRFDQNKQPFAGARVHINGPLTLTNAQPVALTRMQLEADGGLTVLGYSGFEVTGGILVNDEQTYRTADGGCDWQAVASDGGTVTFPDGISGVLDTYAAAPCVQSSTGSCKYMTGYVPNENGLLPDAGFHPYYTFAVYPQSCDDLQGVAQ